MVAIILCLLGIYVHEATWLLFFKEDTEVTDSDDQDIFGSIERKPTNLEYQ